MFGHKGKSLPLSPHTAGTAGTMGILLPISRKIPINHMRDMRKIKPPRGDIARNKIAELLTPELPDNRRTRILAKSCMHEVNISKIFPERAKQRINHVAGITKNESLINILTLKILHKFYMFCFGWV